ncbi:ATP-binding cassette domain-containing protein [Kineosporia sp. A_224]|uniref:ATP-binding cassette domain-containing protein n=1 Tax=Kineosporia sp. A_224 TaxID=1962180 RepID=UPI0013044BB8|nr:ATP-binding cassette domain-containing protein [Kineosporia sp. A_224]
MSQGPAAGRGAAVTADRDAGPVVDVRDAFCLHPVPGGAVAALRGLTLAVAAGERVVVHGPNGSGKTTLLRVLAGEQRLSAGRAVVAGVDVGAATGDLAAWRGSRLGWVDQFPARTLRPELSVLDNVALQQRLAGVAADVARDRSRDLLDRLGVGPLAARTTATLSGGEAQRVAVCAALAHGPRLVLADEPSGQLDATAAEHVYDALAEAVADAGACLVLVSHDRRAARVADRVVRIRDGRLSETWVPGGPERLVVDDRGWVRLPDALRHSGSGLVEADTGSGGAIRLQPVPADPEAAPSEAAPSGAAPSAPSEGDRRAIARGSTSEGAPEQGAPGQGAPGQGEAVAVACGVRKAYGDRVVLAGVDLDVRAGRLHVVRGRSGSGKSTLLRVLLGLERPDAGTVHLGGAVLADLDRAGLAALRRRTAAVVGQDVHLAETVDVRTNLELARAVRGQVPDAAHGDTVLDALGLLPLADREVRLLSGGERQRTAVARALATGPRLLVLDEPTSQLDEASAEGLARALRAAAAGGCAVLVASHDPVLVAAADEVDDLEAG